MNRIVATMDDLPELPFELVLSYLSLEDRLKARAVSRRWRDTINSFKVKSLCYSSRPSGFIFRKYRWVSGAFAENFISSTRLDSFFNTFSRSILSSLKHLRICNLRLKEGNQKAFTEILQSFGQLEQLDIVRSFFPTSFRDPFPKYELRLPMLRALHLRSLDGIYHLTLDAPRLQQVKIVDFRKMYLELVHVEPVERVTTGRFDQLPLKQLKNLKQLYVDSYSGSMDPTLLSGLKKLNEVHLEERDDAAEMLEQKRRYGRADLKVYLYGLLLNGPEDPEMSADFKNYGEEYFLHLIENQSRLADEIEFHSRLYYSTIERVTPEVAINVLKKLILEAVTVKDPVQDIERFFSFLKTFNIIKLDFDGHQPQELFDRLPEHCAIQCLFIYPLPADTQFLLRMKHLMLFYPDRFKELESIRRILEELKCLTYLDFFYVPNTFLNRIIIRNDGNGFDVEIERSSAKGLPDANAVIEFLVKNARSED